MTTLDLLAPAPCGSAAATAPAPPAPRGDRNTRILLTSVFGPYAQTDEYGSRDINPMELWHNQVTRVQGPFSLRMFHRSWGLMLIQANVDAPCTCLDFPTRERFEQELRDNEYDVIGISAIIPNIGKVEEMCRLIRQHQPNAEIVIGGHVANLPGLDDRTGADHVVRGDGVRWFREYLGQDAEAPMRHPLIWSGLETRCMGVKMPDSPEHRAATLIPSVGCPVGCNFCSTSAMFGGKGKNVEFYRTADELFAVMCQLEEEMKVRSFFVMDENFLLRKSRALELLELMRKHDKAWSLYVFSSANAIRMYDIEDLVSLGLSWLWLGLEGKGSQYGKLNGTDTRELVKKLQSHGVRVLGSSIIGLEEHTPDNIDEAIDHAVSHATDFHQFMLYTPLPGTPLHAEHQADGSLLPESEAPLANVHGQVEFNFRHPNIERGQEGKMLLRAFERDFQINGPSVTRLVRTVLSGYQRYHKHSDARIRRRFAHEAKGLWTSSAGSVWATRRWFADNPVVSRSMDELLRDLYAQFGTKCRVAAALVGRYLLHTVRREEERLRAGQTYEPPTFYERNERVPSTVQAALARSIPGLAAAAV